MSRDFCECEEHGKKQSTYVCAHIALNIDNEMACGFVCYPGEDDDGLTDAWCMDCEKYLQANGGEWTDDIEVPDGLSILCEECYRRAREIAKSARKLMVN